MTEVVFNELVAATYDADSPEMFEPQLLGDTAAYLRRGGYFFIEVFVPELQRLPWGDKYLAFQGSDGHLGFDEYDVVNQVCTSNHYFPGRTGLNYFQSRHRYAWPTEYDLMARIAGLDFHERWADWRRSPFTAESRSHVSVWRKP